MRFYNGLHVAVLVLAVALVLGVASTGCTTAPPAGDNGATREGSLAQEEAEGSDDTPLQPAVEPGEAAGEARTVDLGEGVVLELVWVPPGEFLMGSPEGEEGRTDGERPQHRVRISRGFWMGRYEVTQGQWEAVMGSNPSSDRRNKMLPVEHVRWANCEAFLWTLNRRVSGEGFRLPTEAEWEYACRAGTTTRFAFGDDVGRLRKYAWYGPTDWPRVHPVGGKEPNAWGLYDMHGNVWEWCEDDWHDSYAGAPSDGSAWVDAPRGSDRVIRGGSSKDHPLGCRSADRARAPLMLQVPIIGFRVVLPAAR